MSNPIGSVYAASQMMQGMRLVAATLAAMAFVACAPTPPPPIHAAPPGRTVYQAAAKRFAAIVVSEKADINPWLGDRIRDKGPDDSDGGSAAPVAPDGYYLTADHVLSRSDGRHVFIVRRENGSLRGFPARVVWRSGDGDVALVHADVATPDYYRWTPRGQWLPQGTPVMHAGVSTGFTGGSGKLVTAIPPESGFSGGMKFKHDIPLKPGDSGGPVVDANGLLVGINSAVEYLIPLETAFFIESEANRPNVGKLMARIEADRRSRGAGAGMP